MKEFSNEWKASKRPGKQRKYLAKLPIHLRKKLVSVNLSKELRKKYGKRNLPVKKGYLISVMRGKFKKKQGRVQSVDLKKLRIIVEGIQIKKQDGSKASFPLRASNLQIIKAESEEKKKAEENKPEEKKEALIKENTNNKKTQEKNKK
jgi:large subunit ribosomal protein L24